MPENNYWDSEVVVAEIQSTEHTKYVVSACRSKDGKHFVNIREWFKTRKCDEYKPGRHGICIPNMNGADVATHIMEAIGQAITTEV